ncbi:DNA phosphorothioation-dependent restriction protein DptF [Neobacillus cucumis]|nr:DNA phosphorothioation-dependent restriction protein DptF [Neobacillus cucumis]
MAEYTFDFLQDLNPDLVQLGRKIEDIFYEDPHGVFVKSRLFAEILLKDVVKKEKDLEELLLLNQVERILRLEKEGIIEKEIAKSFDTIRYIGNKAAHENTKGDIELALKIHRSLFKISVWYMEVYGDLEFLAPTYNHPVIRHNQSVSKDKLDEMIEQSLSKHLSNLIKSELDLKDDNKKQKSIENSINEVPEDSYLENREKDNVIKKGNEIYGSYLIYELSKLKESSQEAVENSNSFSKFKNYLHVKRPIQDDLYKALKNSEGMQGSQLIFLCGSVGDGKSHLLAYMNEHKPELMSVYKIHNDATESFDPTKNSLDTLAEVLKPFSDQNIDYSEEKMILAINLGVLHNFLESDYAKTSYVKLKEFIDNSKVFETNIISEIISDNHFQLISFSEYHPFEITKQGPKSEYFLELFKRITNLDDENPFAKAYRQDVINGYSGPVLTNYKLLMKKEVQELLSQILIQAIIKHKIIISTRALLNFIHDIIVPANIDEDSVLSTIIDETENLLPNLVFNSSDRSALLKIISLLDPIHIRSVCIDKVLIEINNSTNISEAFNKYINLEGIEEWIKSLEDLGPFNEQSNTSKQLLSATLIRLSFFLSSNLSEAFIDREYLDYMEFLYAYNVGLPPGLRVLYKEVEKAIYYWKGQPIKDSSYIYIDETNSPIRLSQELKLKPGFSHFKKREDSGVFYRFKNTIVLAFQDINQIETVEIEIDFPLYQRIFKVLKGYRPNKKDKEDAIQFIEFVDKLMNFGKKNEELLIHHLSEDLKFKLEYDSFFEQFTFKRA